LQETKTKNKTGLDRLHMIHNPILSDSKQSLSRKIVVKETYKTLTDE